MFSGGGKDLEAIKRVFGEHFAEAYEASKQAKGGASSDTPRTRVVSEYDPFARGLRGD